MENLFVFAFCWPQCLLLTVSRPFSGNLSELSQLFLWCGFFFPSCLTIPARWSPHHRSLHQRCRYKPFFRAKNTFGCSDLRFRASGLGLGSNGGPWKELSVQSASTVQPRLSGHSGGVTAVFLLKPPIFILKNYPILSLITSPLCMACRVKNATNTHFSVSPGVSEDANFTAIEGNLYLFPTCVHVLCLSARCVGGHLITAWMWSLVPSEGEKAGWTGTLHHLRAGSSLFTWKSINSGC